MSLVAASHGGYKILVFNVKWQKCWRGAARRHQGDTHTHTLRQPIISIPGAAIDTWTLVDFAPQYGDITVFEIHVVK